jgi:tRNA-specific 2-thiouridylase
LRDRLGELPGEVVDTEGHILGRHPGTYNFTIGQRRGLRVATGDPRYVVTMDATTRRVVVGSASDAEVSTLRVAGLVWHRSLSGRPCSVQVRSAGSAIPAAGFVRHADGLAVSLERPAVGVAPGQTAVVYEADEVIVAGTIASTDRSPQGVH